MVFAGFALESLPTKEEFLELKNHLGKSSDSLANYEILPRKNMNDPIGDFIIRIKNGSLVGKKNISIPFSKMKLAIAELLSVKGYLGAVSKKTKGSSRFLSVELLYNKDSSPVVSDVKRMSKPSRRLYEKSKNIRRFRRGFGLSVFSTPKGLMADEDAKKNNLGGEFLFNIW